MATNNLPGLSRGPFNPEASTIINMTAGVVIDVGDAITNTTTPTTDEILPRVILPASDGDFVYGVVVGGDADGIYSLTSDTDSKAADVVGQTVTVCTQGIVLAKVSNTATLAVNTPLTSATTDGVLHAADAADDEIIGRLLQASTNAADGYDLCLVDIQREGIFGTT